MAQLTRPSPLQAPGVARTSATTRGGLLTLEHVWLGLAVVAAALACALQSLEPIDYWWSVRLGSVIRELGALPTADPLLFTPVRGSLVDGQWLAKVLLSLVHDAGGVPLSLALRSVVAISTVLLLARACRDADAGPRISALVAGLSVMLFVPGLAIRPQLLAVLPFLVVWRAALRPPRSGWGILGVVLAIVLWANVHGSFILIYPLLGVMVLAAAVERSHAGQAAPLRWALLLAGACAVAPLLNPYGIGLASYVSDTILFNGGGTGMGVLGVEWGAPEIRSSYGALFYGSVLLVIGFLGVGVRPRLAEGLLLLGFGLLAVSSVRHVLWWSLVLVPFLARGFAEFSARPGSRWLPRPGPLPAGSPTMNLACVAIFGLLVLLSLPWTRDRLPVPAARTALFAPETPRAVAEHLAAHPQPGHLFNDTDWSAYFAWRLAPDTRVFVDNRFELHPPAIWEDYAAISRGHVSWERRLAAHGITRLALNPLTQAGLVGAVRESPAWTLTYEDQQALVFVRTDQLAGPAR